MKESLVSHDPEIKNGALCFSGTRVPVKHLFYYLESSSPKDNSRRTFLPYPGSRLSSSWKVPGRRSPRFEQRHDEVVSALLTTLNLSCHEVRTMVVQEFCTPVARRASSNREIA